MVGTYPEYAKKYKKVMNIESLIRKRKKEEANYEGQLKSIDISVFKLFQLVVGR